MASRWRSSSPGLLALIFWGLNLGIDFTGGSTVNVVFASNSVTADQVQQVMMKDHAQDVNVLATKPLDAKNTPAPDRYAYITFDNPIGKNIESEVLKRLQKLDPPDASKPNSGAQITKTMYTVAYPADTKTPTAQMVVLFDKAVKTDDIKAALQNLPKSDPPPVETTSTATPTANATARRRHCHGWGNRCSDSHCYRDGDANNHGGSARGEVHRCHPGRQQADVPDQHADGL